MNRTHLLLLVLSTPAAWAATSTAKPAHPPHRPPDLLVMTLDTDDDRSLSAAEIAAAPTTLADLDLNDDGRLTADEFIVTPPAKPAPTTSSTPTTKPAKPAKPAAKPTPPPPPVLAALDLDADGELSAAEIAVAPTSLATLDANTDGALTRDEFAPPPPKKGPKPAK